MRPGDMPAFPWPGRDWTDPADGTIVHGAATYGLTERAYFAGRALQGLLSNPVLGTKPGQGFERPTDWAKAAINLADALIAELAK